MRGWIAAICASSLTYLRTHLVIFLLRTYAFEISTAFIELFSIYYSVISKKSRWEVIRIVDSERRKKVAQFMILLPFSKNKAGG